MKHSTALLTLLLLAGCAGSLERRVKGLEEELSIVRQQLAEQRALVAQLRRKSEKRKAASTPAQRPPKAVSWILGPDLDAPFVKKVGLFHYAITQQGLTRLLSNPSLIARSARIVPYFSQGRSRGFKVYAIRPRSFFSQLGWQNGDAVLAINGMPLSSPSAALSIYTQVRAAKRVVVELLRRGSPIKLTYDIR